MTNNNDNPTYYLAVDVGRDLLLSGDLNFFRHAAEDAEDADDWGRWSAIQAESTAFIERVEKAWIAEATRQGHHVTTADPSTWEYQDHMAHNDDDDQERVTNAWIDVWDSVDIEALR